MACNMAYIAMYSPRPGAESAKWEDTIPLTVKKQRLHILSNDLQRISRAYNDNCIGKTVRLLVDRADRKKGWLSGKSEGSLTVRFPCPEENANSYIGSFVDTRITSAANLSMEGELIAP